MNAVSFSFLIRHVGFFFSGKRKSLKVAAVGCSAAELQRTAHNLLAPDTRTHQNSGCPTRATATGIIPQFAETSALVRTAPTPNSSRRAS